MAKKYVVCYSSFLCAKHPFGNRKKGKPHISAIIFSRKTEKL